MNDLDMIAQFDFSQIDDGEPQVKEPSQSPVVEDKPEWLFDEQDDDYEGEDEVYDEDVEDEEVEEAEEGHFSTDFDSIDDDVEFKIGGESITKAEIADVVKTRADLKEAHEGISSYVHNLSEVEMRISTYLNASMSETETRLRQVESMLEAPEKLTPSEVQKALIAKRDLMVRQNQLEDNARQIRAAEEERRQQLDLMKIRNTDAELKAKVPGYRGIETLKEVALWAQKEGIDEASLRQSMSPALIKALMDAKVYREKIGGKRVIREAASRKAAPKSVSSKPKPRTVGSVNKMKAFERASKAGDSAAMFSLLED